MKKEEIINCICSYGEEDGLMVQCEMCLCWQHGHCNGIEKPNQVPDNYVCLICKNPLRGRISQKYLNYQEWLYDGKLPIASYHPPNPKQTTRFETLKKCHQLTGNLMEMKRFINGLDVKINIAEKPNHPKLYLWAKKWETTVKKEELNEEVNMMEDIDGDFRMLPNVPEPEVAIEPVKCQQTILDHIEYQQKAVKSRLEEFDAQITALEEAEKSSNIDDSKLKQTIFMILNDLSQMNKVADIHKS
jgi:PHD finger protein 20